MNRNVKPTAHFNGTRLHNACTEFSHLQHFSVRYFFHLARLRNNTGVGSINTVYIRINFTGICIYSSGNGNGRRIRTASTQSGNIAIIRHTLKTGYNDNIAFLQSLFNSFGVNFQNSAFVICLARYNTGLSPCKRYGLMPRFGKGHSHQGYGYLFACRKKHVHFSTVRF